MTPKFRRKQDLASRVLIGLKIGVRARLMLPARDEVPEQMQTGRHE